MLRSDRAYLRRCWAWAHLELVEIAQAEAASAQTVEFAQRVEDFLNMAEAMRARPLVLIAHRCWGVAERALADVQVEAQGRRCPWARRGS